MAATKAQVLVPGLLVQDADPAADAEALDRLAFWQTVELNPRPKACDPVSGAGLPSIALGNSVAYNVAN
jgi:protein ImuB